MRTLSLLLVLLGSPGFAAVFPGKVLKIETVGTEHCAERVY